MFSFEGWRNLLLLAIFDKKKNKKNSSCNFFPIFGHQNHGSETGSGSVSGSGSESAIRKNSGFGSALNQYGSTTLVKT
jgi:hypothetical protein